LYALVTFGTFAIQKKFASMQVMTEPHSGIGFDETENQKMISQMVRDFGAREIVPRIMDWDERQEFPLELFKKMGTLGLMGVLVPEEWGGAGFGYV
jgi:alkylation response protein AidB-like acyl-CoA dehydrogenase